MCVMLVPQKVILALEKDAVIGTVQSREFNLISRNVPTYLKMWRVSTWIWRINHVQIMIIISYVC